MSDYNILSIDGGGMKGLISAIVIDALEQAIKRLSHNPAAKVANYFDLIAGTSAGAILTGIYLCPDSKGALRYDAADAIQFFTECGPCVFSRSLCYRICSLHGLRQSKYPNVNLCGLLKHYFGDVTLSSIRKPCLLPAYNLSTGAPFFFNSISAKKNEAADFLLRDAILASSSAPTYFPPVQITSATHHVYTMIDGGVASNNPALCAFVEAMKMPQYTTYDRVNIFSVGNVSEFTCYPYEKAKTWGLFRWAVPLFNIFMDSNTAVVDYELKMLYDSFEHKTNYVRLETIVPQKGETPSLDDASLEAMATLTSMGNILVQENLAVIEEFARKVVMNNT